MADKRYNEVPTEEVPEVHAYQDAWSRYQVFRDTNPEFFKYLDEIQEEVNTKRQAAEAAVKSKGVSCGDFSLYQYATKYDADKLLMAVGREKFIQVGGVIETQTVHSVDKKRVEVSIACGDIPESAVSGIRVKSARYRKPPTINVP